MFLLIGLLVTVTVLTAAVLIYKLKYKYLIDVTRDIPSAPALPILGHALYFVNKPAQVKVEKFVDLLNIYGNTTKVWLGPELHILFSDVKDVEAVLGSMVLIEKADVYKALEPWLKEGLLVSRGRKWRKRRKAITPAFHFKILEQFIEVFERESRVLVANLERERQMQGSKGINFDVWINLYTLDTICGLISLTKMFLMIGLLVTATILTAVALIYKLKYKYLIDVTRDIPSAPALPILGHAHYFINKPAHAIEETFREFFNIYGNTTKVWLGPELYILLSDVKDIEAVLGSMVLIEKADVYKALEPWLQEGLLVSRGRKWHKRRKAITPAFHFKVLEHFIEVFERESRVLVANLERERQMQGSKGINFDPWINLYTLDTICETAMGVSVHAQTHTDSEYVQAVKTISTVTHKRMFDIIYRFDFTYQFTALAREEKRALAVLHGFTERIIMQRREELLRAQNDVGVADVDADNDDDVGVKGKQAFLDILLHSLIDGKPLSNLDIREEVDTFMFEGHDTTSSAIIFFFYNIATYPECQRKCFAEIVDVFGKDKTKPVTHEALNRLNYVELCIKETLRMFPSVPLLGRKVTKECEINGKTIPAGANIGISPLYLGRKENIFPEANTFKPERFDTSNNSMKINPYSFIPFSAGPRNCIGQRFAILEVKSVVANVLRHFEVEYESGNEPILLAELILRNKDPLMFRLKPREY